MFARQIAASAALTIALPIGVANAQAISNPDCWRSEEIAAARIQDLQTLLMVDTLKCRTTLPAGIESYNKFMEEKGEVVGNSKRIVQARFVRQYGSAGMNKSTDYDTRRSNESSIPVVNVHSCDRVAAFSRIASHATDADLLILAEALAHPTKVEECPVPSSEKPAGMVIEVWKTAPALVVAPATQPPVAVTTPVVAVTAGPVGGTPAAPAAVAGTNTDAVKALQAAVLALSQVAASLQTRETATPAVATTSH